MFQLNGVRERLRDSSLLVVAALFAASGVMPLVLQGTANAATLSSRSVAISTSQPSATGVGYTFTFNPPTTAPIQSMVFQFCNQPLGTCVLPGTDGSPSATETIDVSHVTASAGAITGWTNNGTGFTEYSTNVDAGGCNESDGGSGVATMYCVTRTQAANETPGAKTFTINGIRNPIIQAGNNNEAVYVRITTYSDTAFATAVDSGTVAASIVNQLTVTGRVQERLVFCVFALDDTAGSSSTVGVADNEYPENCSAFEAEAGSNVDIGVVDDTSVAKSPVDNNPPTSNGNDTFAAAMVNTNASGGVSIGYYPTAATTGTEQLRNFRVAGATCNNSEAILTDQCFRGAATTGTDLSAAGTDKERFGLVIACVMNNTEFTALTGGATGAVPTTSNLGAGGSGAGTGNTFNSSYGNADGVITDTGNTNNCENSDVGDTVAWDSTASTVIPLISSNTVVNNESIKMNFGAVAEATTPTGTYTVATTFIATPVF
jgi:hypothetical protein